MEGLPYMTESVAGGSRNQNWALTVCLEEAPAEPSSTFMELHMQPVEII